MGTFKRTVMVRERHPGELRVYLDTSVIGGCLDPTFRDASNALLEAVRRGDTIAVISELTLLEIQEAPAAVREILDRLPESHIEEIALTEECAILAQQYIAAGVIDESKLVDAQHIAMATVYHVDVLVSWNFRHIVNLERIRGYNSVNMKYGYPLLEIRSPREVGQP